MNILIIGASKGLGAWLSNHYEKHKLYTISRTGTSNNAELDLIKDITVSNSPSFKELLGVKLDLVVYLPSRWGESSRLKTNELIEFMNTGPFGFLNFFNKANSMGLLNKGCKLITIGSTAELSDSNPYPAYSLSKIALQEVSKRLQMIHSEYYFTHFTIGGIGEGRIEYSDVKEIISTILRLNLTTYITNITLKSNGEL